MATEYKLSYTANEINEKLGKIDNTSWEDIKGKPFGEEISNAEVVPQGSYDCYYMDGMWGIDVVPMHVELVGEGAVASVTLDGVGYESTFTQFMDSSYICGNYGLVLGGEDNGQPFIVMVNVAENYANVILFDTPPEDESELRAHSIGVSVTGTVVKKIDTKYLYQPDWNNNDESSFAAIKNKPFGRVSEGEVVFDKTVTSIATFGETTDTIVCAYAPGVSNYCLIKNGTYTVEFNNVQYDLTVNNHRLGDIESEEIPFELNDSSIYWKVPITEYENGNTSAHFKITFLRAIGSDGYETYTGYIPIDSNYLPLDDILPQVTSSDDGKGLVVQNGEWTVGEVGSESSLPEVTSSDNGKFLQVKNGAWAAVSLTNVSEVGA